MYDLRCKRHCGSADIEFVCQADEDIMGAVVVVA